MSNFRSPVGHPNVLEMIMAGGEGGRLHPLTNERAKPAVFFGDTYLIIGFDNEADKKKFTVSVTGIVVIGQPFTNYFL